MQEGIEIRVELQQPTQRLGDAKNNLNGFSWRLGAFAL